MLKKEYIALYEQLSEKPFDLQALESTNRDLEQRLEFLLKVSNKEHPPRILIGVFPVSGFNARAVKVESGFLLLVNSGLMIFALQTSALIASSVRAESRAASVPQDIDPERASKIFQEWTRALANGENKEHLDHYPGEARLDMAQFLFASLVDFVIAHELSHIICGHFGERKAYKPDAVAKRLDYYTLSWQQEFEADLMAVNLVKKIYHDKVREESMYLGPALFFEVADAMAEIETSQGSKGLSSHPPADARRAAIITNTHSGGFLARVPLVDNLVETMSKLRRHHG